MGIQYFRPRSLKEALDLLALPNTIPLAGGTHLTQAGTFSNDLVDLQNLGLDQIKIDEEEIEIGATAKLQDLMLSPTFPPSFLTALQLEAPINIRNSASVGGLIKTCEGRSPIVTCLLSMKATVQIQPGSESIDLIEYLKLRNHRFNKHLVTSINIQRTKGFSFEYISRTKFDNPIICSAVSVIENGSTFAALGGYGDHPIVIFNGNHQEKLPLEARNAFSNAQDEWASAEYRSSMAEVLVKRCLMQLATLPDFNNA